MVIMNKQYPWWYKLAQYYLLPHELLHVVAYRIIRKPYHYEWGNHYVKSLTGLNLKEKLFITLFPFIISLGSGLFLILSWMTIVFFMNRQPNQTTELSWHLILLISGLWLAFYSTTAEHDLVKSYHLLIAPENEMQDNRPKPHGSPDNNSHDGQKP